MDSLLPSTAGVETVGAAALFAALYAALALLYVWKTARNPTYTFIVLVFFCVCESLLLAFGGQWLTGRNSPRSGFYPTCDTGRFRRGKGKRRHRDRRDDLFHLGIRWPALLHIHPHLGPVNPPVSFFLL